MEKKYKSLKDDITENQKKLDQLKKSNLETARK